jgi:rod shape-determining protein MreB
MAIDLGTANTVVCARDGATLVSEPSIVAADARTGQLLAVGIDALPLLEGKGVSATQPLRCGAIADLGLAGEMLRCLIRKVHHHRWSHPRVVASVPTGVSGVQRRAVIEACMSAGAREAYLIAKPIAAAIGAGLPVEQLDRWCSTSAPGRARSR